MLTAVAVLHALHTTGLVHLEPLSWPRAKSLVSHVQRVVRCLSQPQCGLEGVLTRPARLPHPGGTPPVALGQLHLAKRENPDLLRPANSLRPATGARGRTVQSERGVCAGEPHQPQHPHVQHHEAPHAQPRPSPRLPPLRRSRVQCVARPRLMLPSPPSLPHRASYAANPSTAPQHAPVTGAE